MSIAFNIAKFFPVILEGVVAIEQTVGNAMAGASKKQLILGSIQVATQIGEQTDNKTIQGISVLIDSIVASLNNQGILGFTKPATATYTNGNSTLTPAQLQSVAPGFNPIVK